VVEAYDRLVAEGVIRAVPKSGFFVARRGEAPMALTEIAPARLPEIDPFWVSRQALDAQEDTDRPGCGWLPPHGCRRRRCAGPCAIHCAAAMAS
jgi:hypothetical protein